MEIYSDYIKTIKSAIKTSDRLRKGSLGSIEAYSSLDNLENDFDFQNYLNESKKSELLPSLGSFAKKIGMKPDYEQSLGAHPDFTHLKISESIERHYIVSMFIDIKGSTNLFNRYSPETVFVISNTIQKAAIHTCLIFGGYIHRLQGDGLFVYFGGKNISEKSAVLNSLNAASIFSYFVKHDIRELFNQEGIENIYTRIGIDLGTDSDVVWALAGIGSISEITTCSLHTSLASKMQGSAESNGIVVGDNIKSHSEKTYYSSVSKRTGKESDRYIFRDSDKGFFYSQYDFNWPAYVESLDFIYADQYGKLSTSQSMSIGKSSQDDTIRLQQLNRTATLINSEKAYTDRNGNVGESSNGVPNQPHRFHYGE